MELDALVRWLDVAGVPPGAVCAGSDAGSRAVDGVWCIQVAAGPDEVGPGWEVFWCEGGERYAWTWFDDEATACYALFGRLVWTRIARGALAPRR